MQKISRIETKFPDWQQFIAEQQEIVFKILRNFTPLCILNNTIYIKYTGKEEHKELVKTYYQRYKFFIERAVFSKYSVTSIQSSKKLNEEKILWICELIEKLQPKKIEFFCDLHV